METKRTIKEILDLQTGQILQASDFFKKPFEELTRVRSELERANQGFRNKFIVCSVCGEKLRMLGGRSRTVHQKSRNFHFAHLHNSNECPIKTTSRYSKEDINRMKYRGATESILHQNLKAMIAQGLHLNQFDKGQVSDIQIEKVVRSLDEQEWKKPDISLKFKDERIAIELQLSTTWLDVITSRQEFYRAQRIYILWVFHVFEHSDDFRKLTYSDIIYTNNNNAYVFGRSQSEKNTEINDLVLTCHYLEYYADEAKVRSKWKNADVTLDMLTYRPANGQLFYFDSLGSKKQAEREAEDYRKKELEREQLEEQDRRKRIGKKRELNDRLQRGLEDRKALEKTITGLQQNIDHTIQKLNTVNALIPGLEEEIRMLYIKLEHTYLYGLPSQVADLVRKFQEEFLEITAKIKSLNEARNELIIKDKNIRQLPEKIIDEKVYRVLDKIKNWDFITQYYKTLFCFRIDQPNDLWNKPKVQGILPHQLQQLQFNNKVWILADFNERLEVYNRLLSQIDADLSLGQQRLISFQTKFRADVHQQFTSFYDQEVRQLQDDIQNNKSSIKASEQLMSNLNKEIKKIRKYLEQYYYVDDDF